MQTEKNPESHFSSDNRQVTESESIALVTVSLYFLAFLAFAVVTQRGLVADGANYFVKVLEFGEVYSPQVTRWSANLLTQWPVLLGLSIGITHMPTLSFLFNFGLYYLVPVTLTLSWLLLPSDNKTLILLPLLGLGIGWMACSYTIINQSQVLALWFWPTAFALLFIRLNIGISGATVLILVVPTILMHEGMSFLGPVLATIAFIRAKRANEFSSSFFWIIIGLWLTAASALGLYFTLAPISHSSRGDFIDGILKLRFLFNRQLNIPLATFFLGSVVAAGCTIWPSLFGRRLILWMMPFVLILLIAGLSPIIFPEDFQPLPHSDARSWVVAVPFILVVLGLGAYAWGLSPKDFRLRPLVVTVLVLTVASQITWHITATIRWSNFTNEMRGVLVQGVGLVSYEEAFIQDKIRNPPAWGILVGGWTFPHLSVAFSPEGRVNTIIRPPKWVKWQEFDPADPHSLPRLPWLDYTGYERAMGRISGEAEGNLQTMSLD